MKKIFIPVICILLFVSIFSLGTLAAENLDTAEGSLTDSAASEALPSDGEQSELPPDAGSSAESLPDEKNGMQESEAESPFEIIFRGLEANSDKIFSLLSFITSAVVIFAYRRGFLPLVKNSLATLKCGVKLMEEESQKQSASSLASGEFVSEKLAECENILEKITESIGTVEARLLKAESESRTRSEIFSILLTENELLYEIFMSSSLPEYEKERVAKKLREISTAITTPNGGSDGDEV